MFFEGGSEDNAKRVKTRSFANYNWKCFVEKEIDSSMGNEKTAVPRPAPVLGQRILQDSALKVIESPQSGVNISASRRPIMSRGSFRRL